MAVITITATGIGPELVSGIPQLVVLSTNWPATVFYTLDGSQPVVSSSVYIGPIEIPGEPSVRLRAMAVSGPDIGMLDVTFNTDVLPANLISPKAGSAIIVDAYDVIDVLVDGYGLDAYNMVTVPVRASDYELKDLDIKFSRTDRFGNPPGTMIRIGFPDPRAFNEEKQIGISHQASSPNNRNAFFNPRSLYITIDGRDGYDDQIHDGYRIINRPSSGTMDVSRYLGGKMLLEQNPYVSGGLVRSFFNREKGIIVSYYFDSNETRWIKSIQDWNPSEDTFGVGGRNSSSLPVFKWIHNRRSMI